MIAYPHQNISSD